MSAEQKPDGAERLAGRRTMNSEQKPEGQNVGWSALLGATLLLLGLAACDTGPSCEERGGRRVFTHFMFIYQPALKMNQLIPQYRCDIPAPAVVTPNAQVKGAPRSGVGP